MLLMLPNSSTHLQCGAAVPQLDMEVMAAVAAPARVKGPNNGAESMYHNYKRRHGRQ